MADIETRIVIGADTGALESGMAAALAAVRAASQGMRIQLVGLGATARQVQGQIGAAMAQVGAAVRPPVEQAWTKLSAPIERSISSALTNAVLGIRQSGGMREVMLGIEKSVVGVMMGNVVKGLGNSLLKPLFSDVAKGLGGSHNPIMSLLATALGLNTTVTAANTLATAASTSAATASAGGSLLSAAGSAGGLLGGINSVFSGGGFFGKIFSGIGSLFAFSHGGLVPSAAGGWSLPAFAGAMPAMLHSREMVLPADISAGLQGMIRGGGAGDVHVHNHFHGPADGASVGRWFAGNKGALAETIRDAWNSGALAFP